MYCRPSDVPWGRGNVWGHIRFGVRTVPIPNYRCLALRIWLLLVEPCQLDLKMVRSIFVQVVNEGLVELVHDAGVIFGTEPEVDHLF